MGTGYFNKTEDKETGTGYFATPTTAVEYEPGSDKKWYDYLKPGGLFGSDQDFIMPNGKDIIEMQQQAMIAVARPIGATQNGLAWLAGNLSPAPNVMRATNLLLQTKQGCGKEALESWKKSLSLTDAIKRGWSGKGVGSDIGIAASAIVPNEWIENVREKVFSSGGAGAKALFGIEFASDLVIDALIGMQWAKGVSGPIKTGMTFNKIKTGESFTRNAARTMKQYLNLEEKVNLTEDDVVRYFYRKHGAELPEGALSEEFISPVRPDINLVKELDEKKVAAWRDYMNFKATYKLAESNYLSDIASQKWRNEHYGVQDAADIELKVGDDISQARAKESARLYMDDFKQTEQKLAYDLAKEQLTEKADVLHRVDNDLILAKMGRPFLGIAEEERRATRLSYIEALLSQTKKEIMESKARQSAEATYQSELKRYRTLRKQGIKTEKPIKENYSLEGVTLSEVEKGDAYFNPNLVNIDDMTKKLAREVSAGKTDDIAKLSPTEMYALFNQIDMMGINKALTVKLNFLEEWFSPAFRVFEIMKATPIYHFVSNQSMKSLEFNHSAKLEWAYHLKQMGLSLWKNYKADSSNPILRRVFRYADGLDPADPEKYIEKTRLAGYPLSEEQKAFIRGTYAVDAEQTTKELKAARYINDKANELAELGIAQGKLYRPSDYELGGQFYGQAIPEGAVPVRSNYITHIIDTLSQHTLKDIPADYLNMSIDEIHKLDPKTLPFDRKLIYDLDDLAKFFERSGVAATNVKINQLLLRQGVQEGLIENADHAFKTMIYNESKKFFLEPAYEGAINLAKMTGKKEIEEYTTDWVNYGLRGIPTTLERDIFEPMSKTVRKGWNATAGNILKQAYWEEKDNAFRTLSNHYRRYIYSSAMGFNIGSALKNATQVLLNIPVIGTKSSIIGIASMGTKEGRECLKFSSMVLSKGINIHEFDMSMLSRIESAGSWLFRVVDQWANTGSAFNGALYRSIMHDEKALATLVKDYGYKKGDIRSFYRAVSEMLPTGDLKPHTQWADEIAKMTQYSYLPYDMPKALWTPHGKLFGQFMTWPMNYFGQYLPRLWDMGELGKGPFGTIPYHKRVGLIKHILMMEAIAQAADRFGGVDLGYLSALHAPIKTGEAIYNRFAGDKRPEEYVSSVVPSGGAPFYQAVINGLLTDFFGRIASGRFPTFTNLRKGLVVNPYPKTTGQAVIDAAIAAVNMAKPGIAPGNVIQKGEDVFINKTKSPLELLGIKTEKKKSGGARVYVP